MKSRLVRASSVAALLTAGLAAPATADLITGTSGPDVLVGTPSADTIRGYAGNDVLRGRRGSDHLYGGPGADILHTGRDTHRKDVVHGGRGADRITIRVPDVVYAGAGNDTITVRKWAHYGWGWAFPTIDCGPGRDTVISAYGRGPNTGCERAVKIKD